MRADGNRPSDLLRRASQDLRRVGAVLLKRETNDAGRQRPAGEGEGAQIQRTEFAEASGRVERAGVEAQTQTLHVVAGERAIRNCSENLFDSQRVEVRGKSVLEVS